MSFEIALENDTNEKTTVNGQKMTSLPGGVQGLPVALALARPMHCHKLIPENWVLVFT